MHYTHLHSMYTLYIYIEREREIRAGGWLTDEAFTRRVSICQKHRSCGTSNYLIACLFG